MSDSSSLHVPQSNSTHSMAGMKSIMDAYNSQSKIQLYDDDSAMSNDEISGVKGRDIPLSALRPKQAIGTDENGKPVYSKSQLAKEFEMRSDITKAYNKMNGVEESSEGVGEGDNDNIPYTLNNIKDAEIEYIEDVPDDNEGLLHYLETCITNAEANLEMLKSLYAALNG